MAAAAGSKRRRQLHYSLLLRRLLVVAVILATAIGARACSPPPPTPRQQVLQTEQLQGLLQRRSDEEGPGDDYGGFPALEVSNKGSAGGRRMLVGSRAPTCTYNECRGCRHRCSIREVPIDASDPINSAYHYKCICHV